MMRHLKGFACTVKERVRKRPQSCEMDCGNISMAKNKRRTEHADVSGAGIICYWDLLDIDEKRMATCYPLFCFYMERCLPQISVSFKIDGMSIMIIS